MRVGELSILPSVRYVLTLDTDTRLPRGAARTLIGIASHPLNRPHVDPVSRRVTEGFGILQPRVSVTLTSAAGSLFARVYAGHTGVDPYSTAVSDTYQDLFGEGIFTGKGLYDVDAFRASVDGRVPDDALLSHDLFEGLYARTALVSDVEVVDDYPANVLAHARRQHRWVRGDWQILAWLFPVVPTHEGFAKNTLPLLSQWKILDNLRRSLVAPSLLALFGAAWTVLPGLPFVWTLGGLAVVGFPLLASLAQLLRGSRADEPARVHVRGVVEDLSTAFAQAVLTLVFLPYHAWEMVHAIGLTLVRLVVTQRRLLDWETAAAQAVRAAGLLSAGLRSFAVEMAASPLAALGLLAMTAMIRPGAFLLALPFAALWVAAPAVAYWLSQPTRSIARELSLEDRELLTHVARKTWRYFETLCGPGDHGLPPDNLQEVPASRRRPPDLADEHRDVPPLDARGARPRIPAARRDGREAGPDADDDRDRSSATRGTSSTGTTPRTSRRSSRDTSRPSTAATSPERSSTLAEGCRQARGVDDGRFVGPGGAPLRPGEACPALADGMSFGFLFDPERQLFSIGYRLPDAVGPGRLDSSFYDLLASESRLASFFAIAKGDVPQSHWFHLGRLVVSVEGVPTLVSWSASMFEYLMPLLLMRTYPGTLLDKTCRMAVRQQVRYGRSRGVPWGISESAFNIVDRAGNYQYKAFGVPGLGLKRGLADELVIAPYATALAALVDPGRGRAEPPAARGGGRRGTAGLLRRDRLHAPRTARRHVARAAVGRRQQRRRQGVPRAPRGNDPRLPRERPPGRRDDRPVPRGPEGPGDGAPAAGADTARGAHHRAAPAGGEPRGAGRRAAPAPTPPFPAHALPERADPLQRRLRRDRHERRRRGEPPARARRHPVARRTRRVTREASSSTCATSTPATSGPRPISPSAGSPRTTSWSSSPRRWSSRAATTRSRRGSRSRSRPRTTPRCDGSR